MVDIVTRAGKGSPLTNNEVDANFTNLAEVSGITGEPMGHEDRTTSTISFNASTRTFTIAPVNGSFTVWCKGKKVVVSSAQTVTIPNTSGMHSIYYDANGTLSSKIGYFTFSTEAPTAYVYWNATTGAAPYFGDERHGVVLDWQTHEYLHRTRGAAIANGFAASGYTLNGNGSSNAHAQLTLEGGTFFDEDMKIIVTATNTPTAGTWEQDLLSPARIPVLYLSGTGWVIDAPTDYPLKQGTTRPQYNALSGGVWSTSDVANNKYATSWILATNNLTYPVIAVIGQAESDSQTSAEAVDFTSLQLPGFPSVEFRPLYKLVFQCADSYSNTVKASLVSITDIRSLAAAGVAASLVTDHGALTGLSDDDHPQYLSVDTVRTSLTAAVKASFLPSQTGNSGKFLTTDATSASWAALTSSNITTALGFTPYNATNPAGYISGITSANVTIALGFTPYNATNPSGYVTAAGARGAISVTGAGSYDSATGVINIVGGVTSFNTRTGAISLTSADVTTALGFTPYNNTNPNNYLTGITSMQVTTALGYTPYNSSNPSGYITGITSGMVTTALGFTPYNATNPSGYITSSALSGYLTSASAASTYLPLSGGGLTGNLGVLRKRLTFSSTASDANHSIYNNYDNIDGEGSFDGMKMNVYAGLKIRTGNASGAVPTTIFDLSSSAVNVSVAIQQSGNQVLHAGNYSSYALPLSGGTLTGLLTVNSGSSIQAATNLGIYAGSAYYIRLGTPASLSAGIYIPSNGNVNIGVETDQGYKLYVYGTLNTLGAITQNGSQVLTAANYNSYVPTLTGTGATGTWGINISGNAATSSSTTGNAATATILKAVNVTSSTVSTWNPGGLTYQAWGQAFTNSAISGDSGDITMWLRPSQYTGGGTELNMYIDGDYYSGTGLYKVLNAGNYNSYAPTLTGTGATGTWAINITGSAGSVPATAVTNLYSPNGSSVVAADSAFPSIVNSMVYTLGYGPSGNDGHILGMSWAGTTSSYGAQLWLDTDPTNRMSLRSRTSGGVWNSWADVITSWSDDQTKSGYFQSNSSLRAPIFYDSNDTSYYVNPNSNSSIYNLSLSNYANGNQAYPGIIITGYTGYNYNFLNGTWGSSITAGFLANCADQWEFAIHDSGERVVSAFILIGGASSNRILMGRDIGWGATPIQAASSFMAPIFYDLDDTAYYVNPNSETRIYYTSVNAGQEAPGAANSSNQGLILRGNYNTNTWAHKFHKYDNGSGVPLYLSMTAGTGVWTARQAWGDGLSYTSQVFGSFASDSLYSIIFYDSNNTGYYSDPASTSNLNVVGVSRAYAGYDAGISNSFSCSDWFRSSGNTGWYNATYAVGIYATDGTWVRTYNGAQFYSSTIIQAGASVRAPVFYDSDNTAYYVDPNGTSNFVSLTVANTISGSVTGSATFLNSSNYINQTGTTGSWNADFQNTPAGTARYGGDVNANTSSNPGGTWWIQQNFRHGNGSNYWGIQVAWGWEDNANRLATRNVTGGSFGSWVYYLNSNNYTSYAPSLTGSGASGTWGISISGSASTASYLPTAYAGGVQSNPQVYFNEGIGLKVAMTGVPFAWCDTLWINGYGGSDVPNMIALHTARNGQTRMWMSSQSNRSTSYGTQYEIPAYGLLYNTGALYAGIFYDAEDTGYYVNPNATSQFSSINANASCSFTAANYCTYMFGQGNTGAVAGVGMNVYSSNGAGAIMAFHRGGYYAVNFGLDSDNVIRIGGWSASANRFQFDMSGNFTAAGNVTAYSDERLKKDWADLSHDFIQSLAQVKSGTYTRIDSEERQVGVSAQGLQKFLGEAVMTDAGGMLSVNYGGAALASAVELAKYVTALEERISQLESLINKLIGD